MASSTTSPPPRAAFFADVPVAAPDAILGVTEAFRNDPHPDKVNLGVGVYQDAHGKIPLLESVRRAAEQWRELEDSKTYLPIDGVASFNAATQELLFGTSSQARAEKRIVTVQSVGGSGALKLGIELIRRFLPQAAVYVSDPTWENHRVLFEAAGAQVRSYPYYDPTTRGLRAAAMLAALREIEPGNVVLLHACCHNPTGVDLDPATWEQVLDICVERGLLPFIDCAYQGFAEGLTQDATAIRLCEARGIPFLVASSFAKSLSLYRERVGALSVVTDSPHAATAVLSQLKRIVRTIYSSPPSYGAQLAGLILTTPQLRTMWESELSQMCARIQAMRALFCEQLAQSVPDRDFSFILKQRGMFSYSGLSAENVRALRDQYHIYALESGRICVAAMNTANMPYICSAIASVLKGA